jgi:hypothetical protein
MQALQKLIRFARKSPREQLQAARATVHYDSVEKERKVPHLRNDRTAYVIGLFGTGRRYVHHLIEPHIGERRGWFASA